MRPERTIKIIYISISKACIMLSELFCLAVLSRILSTNEYATYKQTLLIYTSVSPILLLGLPQALYYFLPRNENNNKNILTTNLLLVFITGFIFSFFLIAGGNNFIAKLFNNPKLAQTLFIFSPYFILKLPIFLLTPSLTSLNKIKLLTIFTSVSNIFIVTFVTISTLHVNTAISAIYATIFSQLIIFFPTIYIIISCSKGKQWLPNFELIINQLRFSVPLGLAFIIGTMQIVIDKFIVSSMCSIEDFAIYINGAIEIPVIGIITGSVISILTPEFSTLYKEKEYNKLLELWRSGLIKTSCLIFPVIIYLFFMSNELIELIFSKTYINSAAPFRLYLFFAIVRITNFSSVEMAAGKNKVILTIFLLNLIINLILSIILVKIYGYMGAVIGTLITTYLFSIPVHLYIYHKILFVKIREILPLKDLSKIMLISIICSPLILVKTYLPNISFIKLGATSLIYFPLIFLIFQSFNIGNIKTILNSLLKKDFN